MRQAALPVVNVTAEHLHLLTPTCAQGRASFVALLKNWFWCVPVLPLSHLMCQPASGLGCEAAAVLCQ